MARDKQLAHVTEMPRTSVTPDGSFAEMELKYSNGTSQFLRFQPKTFLALLSRTYQLLANQLFQAAQAQGHFEVQPIRAVVSSAQEAVGGNVVVLMLKMENGLPTSFSLEASEAKELHRQLGAAIEKSKTQSEASRH